MNLEIFIIIAVAIFIFWQFWIYLKSKRSVGKNIPYTELDHDISESIKDKTGLIYFFSTSCSNCEAQTPAVNKIKEKYENVLLVNVYEYVKTAKAFDVIATPSILFFGGNKIKGHFVGVKEEDFLIQRLESLQ